MTHDVFIGIDVQTRRGCAVVAIDANGRSVAARALPVTPVTETIGALFTFISSLRGTKVAIGIDAPRQPLLTPRGWYWERKANRWRRSRAADVGWGRHCEVVIAAYRLANPQWTPTDNACAEWMKVGFAIFDGLSREHTVHEVFPSASYSQLSRDDSVQLTFPMSAVCLNGKDVLDAYTAALTVREFAEGKGCAVGNGDSLGQIVLPRPLPNGPQTVLHWPA
jgi:hypothetical protein